MSDLSEINASFGIQSISPQNFPIPSPASPSPVTVVAHQVLGNFSDTNQSSLSPARVSHAPLDADVTNEEDSFDNLFAAEKQSVQETVPFENAITESTIEDFNDFLAKAKNVDEVENLPPDLQNAALLLISDSDYDKVLTGNFQNVAIGTVSAFKGHPITSLVPVGFMTPAGRLHFAPAVAAPIRAAAAAHPAAVIMIGGRPMPMAKLVGRLGRDLTTHEFSLCNAICLRAMAQLRAKRENAAREKEKEKADQADRRNQEILQREISIDHLPDGVSNLQQVHVRERAVNVANKTLKSRAVQWKENIQEMTRSEQIHRKKKSDKKHQLKLDTNLRRTQEKAALNEQQINEQQIQENIVKQSGPINVNFESPIQ